MKCDTTVISMKIYLSNLFLQCARRYSESLKSSSLPNMNSSLDHSKDNAESGLQF